MITKLNFWHNDKVCQSVDWPARWMNKWMNSQNNTEREPEEQVKF